MFEKQERNCYNRDGKKFSPVGDVLFILRNAVKCPIVCGTATASLTAMEFKERTLCQKGLAHLKDLDRFCGEFAD